MMHIIGANHSYIWQELPFKNFKCLTFLPDGNKILCSLDDRLYATEIYNNSRYDQFFKPSKGDVVVDAGAHVGFYTLKAAKEVGPDGTVIAIEPENKNFNLLATNVRINKYRNIKLIKCALYNFNGKARLFLKARSVSHSLIPKVWTTPIIGITRVHCRTLDSLLQELSIRHVDLLKLNIEGAEFYALLGCREFLSKQKIFKIVATPHPPYYLEAAKIKNLLENFGYTVKVASDKRYVYAILKT
jgi:FkbM family methyltransferase